jgi:hypothetical protein
MRKRRLSKQLFVINDRLLSLEKEEGQVSAELDYHRSLADDAVRDAAVFESEMHRNAADRALADVERFERSLDGIDHRREILEYKRDRLMERMSSYEDLF